MGERRVKREWGKGSKFLQKKQENQKSHEKLDTVSSICDCPEDYLKQPNDQEHDFERMERCKTK
jgi:hypothetical protein